MAKQTINIGTAANDSTGDPLRTSFNKVNSNFTEVYNSIGALSTVATSGLYSDLSGTPTLFSGSYNDLSNTPSLFDGNYSSLSGAPTIPADIGDLTNNAGFVANGDTTLTLAVSTTAPASPATGMFAVADGNTVGWDPKGTNLGVAYPVFYDGSSWTALL